MGAWYGIKPRYLPEDPTACRSTSICRRCAPSGRRRYRPGDLPVSERIHTVGMSLPTFTYEPLGHVDAYADGFEKVAANHGALRSLGGHRRV
jgi:hypothetical protein